MRAAYNAGAPGLSPDEATQEGRPRMAEACKDVRRALPGRAAQWLIVAVLAAVAVLLAAEMIFPPSPAAAQTGSAGSAGPVKGVFAIAGQLNRDTYGLYLVDLENDTICVYAYLPGNPPTLRLRAARTFVYDCQLDEYNTEPAPSVIAKKVSEARRLKDAKKSTEP